MWIGDGLEREEGSEGTKTGGRKEARREERKGEGKEGKNEGREGRRKKRVSGTQPVSRTAWI